MPSSVSVGSFECVSEYVCVCVGMSLSMHDVCVRVQLYNQAKSNHDPDVPQQHELTAGVHSPEIVVAAGIGSASLGC